MREVLGSRWRAAAKEMRQWAVPPRRGSVRPAAAEALEREQRETMRSARKKVF